MPIPYATDRDVHRKRHPALSAYRRGPVLRWLCHLCPAVLRAADDAGAVHQFRTSAESRFSDSNLKFVHVADDIVRLFGFLDFTEVFA